MYIYIHIHALMVEHVSVCVYYTKIVVI